MKSISQNIHFVILSFLLSTCTKEKCTVAPQKPFAKPATNILSSGFTANWNRVIGGTLYNLEVATDSLFSTIVKTEEGILRESGGYKEVAGLTKNTTYYYRINANNDCGQSEYSNVISVTTLPFANSNTWQQKANFGGTAREGAVGFSIGGKGYIGTGNDGSNPTNDFWEYDTTTNTWTQKASLILARESAAGFSIGTRGYIGTGRDVSDNNLSDFWEWNQATNTWSAKAAFGGGIRQKAIGFSMNGKGYIGTGSAGASNNKSDFWEYDPASDWWTQRADFGGGLRTGAVGFSISGKGYVGTGAHTTDFWEYNPSSNSWTQKTNFPGTVRDNAAGFAINNKGYIGTGHDGISTPPYKKDFWEYDPSLNTWTQKPDVPGMERKKAVGFAMGGKGYIGTGGISGSKDFFEYTQ